MRWQRHLLILLIGIGLLPVPALAGQQVAVLVYGGGAGRGGGQTGPPAPQRVAQALREALAQQPGTATVAGSIEKGMQALKDEQSQPLLMKMGAVRERLAVGRQRLAQVELERAEAILLEAEREFQGGGLFALPGAVALYAEVLRWRGVALFELHRSAESAQVFRRAQGLLGTGQLTEADVRPEALRFYRRVLQQEPAKVPLRLRVQVRPGPEAAPIPVPLSLAPSVSLAVDGVAVLPGTGRAPAGLLVPPGEHVVSLHVPGYRPRVLSVEVPEEGLDLSLAVPADPAEKGLLSLRVAPARAGLSVLCAVLGLDGVVLAAAGPDAGEYVLLGQRFSCADKRIGALAEVRGDRRLPLRTVAERLLTQLNRDAQHDQPEVGLLSAPALLHPRPAPPPHRPFYTRPWIWLAAAAVSAGVVLGLVLYPRPQPQTSVVLDPSSFALRVGR